jgi:excisionase family DNA binding protein
MDEDDRGITVAEAAGMLGCDQSTVRKMLRAKILAGNTVGTGKSRPGVRVRLSSVRAHIERGVAGDPVPAPSDPPRSRLRADYYEALRQLRAAGINVPEEGTRRRRKR